jgi:hypothetical protein
MGGAERPGRDLCHAVADAACDEVNAHGLNGFGEGHRWQDRSEPVRQHRLARPRGAEDEDIMGRMPASRSASQALWKYRSSAVNLLAIQEGIVKLLSVDAFIRQEGVSTDGDWILYAGAVPVISCQLWNR